jgi:O-antigen ligase
MTNRMFAAPRPRRPTVTATLRRPDLYAIPAALLAAVALGAIIAVSPKAGAGLMAFACLLVVTIRHPVAHLALLLGVTALVPFSIQNQFSFGGSAGLSVTDVLIVLGLARVALVLPRQRMDRGTLGLVVAAVALLALFVVQAARGIMLGNDLSEVGFELRILLALAGTALIALPLLADEARLRRLLGVLVGIGLVLGLAGIAQWFLGAAFSEAAGADFGVREGVDLTTTGTGSLQYGLYVYPVAVILAFAFLLSARARLGAARVLVMGVLLVNTICLVLTFERTFWVTVVFGCLLVALRSGALERVRLLVAAPVVGVMLIATLWAIAPQQLTTARERLFSLGQYEQDASVSTRLLEAYYTLEAIDRAPMAGSGLGAEIYWGRPAYGVPAREESFVHNGYLWLSWKLGIPAAILVYLALAVAAALRGRARAAPLPAALAVGAQSVLAAMIISSVTFPALASLQVTALLGMLLAAIVVAGRAQRVAAARGGTDGARPAAVAVS